MWPEEGTMLKRADIKYLKDEVGIDLKEKLRW